MKKEFIIKKVTILLTICITYIMISPLYSFAICQEVGKPAPEFALEEIGTGKTVKLSDFKGKPVLITFWATWCERCWEELDYIKARFEKDGDVAVLLINMETQNLSPSHVKKIKEKAKEHSIKLPMLLDKKLQVWDAYCVNSLPSTIIVDKDGNVAFAEPNFYFASRDSIEEVIKKLLKK